jgi:hypothetical protein
MGRWHDKNCRIPRYTDVAPMDGVIVGSGGQRIEVAVSVMPAD